MALKQKFAVAAAFVGTAGAVVGASFASSAETVASLTPLVLVVTTVAAFRDFEKTQAELQDEKAVLNRFPLLRPLLLASLFGLFAGNIVAHNVNPPDKKATAPVQAPK